MSLFHLAAKTVVALVTCAWLLAGGVAAAADAAPAKLVIVKAVYGDLPDGAKVVVTEKVAALVKDNALTVDATNDNFTDPAEGVGKKLQVDYTLDGVAGSKTVEENATLTIAAASAGANPSKKLVIVKAVYGDVPNGASVVVTDKVAAKVKDDALTVDATNDNFTDPADGVGKKLVVDYTLDGIPSSKTVEENATLTIAADEKLSKKLVIRKATYGDLPDGAKVDVTYRVAGLIKDDALSVDASNDAFGDPAVGTGKKLTVDYTFNGVDKSKSADEGQTLTISNTGE